MKKVIVTTEDIAQKLNISRGTVSRALNGSQNISEDMRKLVLETAKALEYKPNKAARSLVMKRKYFIGLVVFSEPRYFWKEILHGVARAKEELYDYGVIIEYVITDIRNPEEQIGAVRNLIKKGVNAIAISPNNPELMADLIDEVTEQGIPVLTISNDVPNSCRLCYVGSNYIQSGRLAGEILGKTIESIGKVAILTFASAVLPIQQRITGFREVISQFHNIEVIGPYKLSRTGEDVYDFVINLLLQNPDLKGIFVSYGVLEIVGKAVKAAGKAKDVKLIGYDLSDEITDLINDGIVQAVICQEPFNQGYYAVKILYNCLLENGKCRFSIVNIKLEAIFRENMSCYREQEHYYKMLYNI